MPLFRGVEGDITVASCSLQGVSSHVMLVICEESPLGPAKLYRLDWNNWGFNVEPLLSITVLFPEAASHP